MAGLSEVKTRATREALLIWWLSNYRLNTRTWKGCIVAIAVEMELATKYGSRTVFET